MDGLNELLVNNLSNENEKKSVKLDFEERIKSFFNINANNKKVKIGSLQAAKNYLMLIKTIRTHFENDADEFLSKTFKSFMNKDKLNKLLVEIYTASQKKKAWQSLIENLGLNDSMLDFKKTKLIDDFLVAIALSTNRLYHISSNDGNIKYEVMKNLLEKTDNILMDNLRIKSTLNLGSSIVAEKNDSQPNEYLSLINEKIKKCTSLQCETSYLESLKNSQVKKSIDYLHEYLDRKIESTTDHHNSCFSILKSMKNFKKGFYDRFLFEKFLKIFNNDKLLAECRSESLEIILENYDQELIDSYSSNLVNIFFTLYKELKTAKKHEFVYYSLKLLKEKAKNSPNFG